MRRKKMNQKSKIIVKKSVWSLVGIVLAAGIGVGDFFYTKYKADIIGALCPPIADSKAHDTSLKAGKELSKTIVQDGAVLVKNDDKTLPLSKGTKVNL